MENGLSSTGDSKLDQAINQWLQFDKVRCQGGKIIASLLTTTTQNVS